MQYFYLPSWLSFLVDETKATETTYQNLESMANGADAMLLSGPPFANPIRQHLVANREPGTPVWNPVYRDGGLVRFAENASQLRSLPGAHPTVLYLQNSSDPIVWWSPQLLVRAPEWLDDPRGHDISPDMHWYPGITFWQTAVDLAFSTNVPTGHGHVYGSLVVDAWAALLPPPEWTTADSDRLKALLDGRPR